ncbi:MAG: YfhO family protein [Gemmatimonadota bacterium]|nr:YfhO family protein [Gemmatimonadota bacterium]
MPDRRSSSQPKPPSALTNLLSRPWVPIVFFALLTAGYFYHILITGDVIYGSDTGAEFHRGNEPFAEALKKLPPKNWSRFMGGTPESSALRSQYYPLIVIDLFTSEHRYFGWRYIFAMFTAGYFMYLCTRSFGLHPLAALIAGAAYASAPAFLSFTHAGHFAKMTVIGLFPLMYWALNRGMDTRRIIYFLILGGTVGIAIYSPHLQMAYFALWTLGLLFLYKLIRGLSRNGTKIALYQTLLSAGAICLGLAIGAEGVIPQYWNTKTSSKRAATEQTSDDGYEFASSWSLHPEEIFALAIPEFVAFDTNTTPHKYWGRNAFKINSEYVGIVPLFFAIFALSRIRKKNHIAFLLGLFILAVAYALGPHTPLHKLLYHLIPGVSVLRAPGMIAFLFSFALCALGAYGLHRLITDDTAPETAKKLGITGGICTAILLLFAFVPSALLSLWQNIVWTDISAWQEIIVQTRDTSLTRQQIAQANLPLAGQGALLAALFVGILTVISYLCAQNKLQIHTFALVLLTVLLIDTWRIDKMFLNYVNPNRVQPQERVNADAVAFLKRDNSLFRVLALPDHNQMPLPGIDLVTGFNDFAIKRYDHILKSGAINNPAILNLLNTRYIVAPVELNIPHLQKIAGRQGLHIYRNPGALPWFYLTPQYEIIPDENQILQKLTAPNTNPIQTALLEENPGIASDTNASETDSIERLEYNEHQGHLKLSTTAPGPRILVISQNHHPNWTATVNGEPKPLIRANYLWTAVALEPGEHIVELTYRDPIVATTRWITLGGVIILIAAIALCLYKPYEKTDNTN